jgi:hypothetical protein
VGKKHGNAVHQIDASYTQLRKGKPFDGFMQDLYLEALGRRGLVEADLDTLGARGDIIRHTARLGVVVELVWSGMVMAGALGDVASFYQLLKQHGHRFDQAIRALHRELELQKEDAGVLDYEAILESERNGS